MYDEYWWRYGGLPWCDGVRWSATGCLVSFLLDEMIDRYIKLFRQFGSNEKKGALNIMTLQKLVLLMLFGVFGLV